jgi:hypothetical protein
MRRADQGGDARRRGGDLLQRPRCRLQEPGAQQEVLGRVARDGELREEDEVGAPGPCLLEAGEDAVAVPVQVADDRVDLRERGRTPSV